MKFSEIFRMLPVFRGKKRVAKLLLAGIDRHSSIQITGKLGLRYYVPNTIETVGADLMIDGIYEEHTIERIVNLCPKNGIVFDVGANIGAISLPVATQIQGTVYAFEPSRMSFQFLTKNTLDNNLTNIVLSDEAVYSKDQQEVAFFAVEEKYGHSSLAPTYDEHESYIVRTVSIDEFCKRRKIKTIDVLKIDVQGFEIEVLTGSQEMLKQKRIKNVIFEFEEWAEEKIGMIGRSQEFLKQHGYDLFTLADKKIEGVINVGSEMLWAKVPEEKKPTILDKFSKTKMGMFILNKKHALKYNSTSDFWEKHYADNKNSGDGSYGQQAQYKAEIINEFIKDHSIKTVVEFGSGDGNQLRYLNIPNYIGLDISQTVIQKCKNLFEKDGAKRFFLYDPNTLASRQLTAELTLSLDVIYHLISEKEYNDYMHFLFDTSSKYVIIYSWIGNSGQQQHVKHRLFTDWIRSNKKDWVQAQHIPSISPQNICDFYIYSKKEN